MDLESKRFADGTLAKFKACLVIKGFKQRYGIDYYQTFRPATKMQTIRSILSLTANNNFLNSLYSRVHFIFAV